MKCDDFLMQIRPITLWPWPLTRWPWKFVVDLLPRGHIVCSTFDQNRTIRGRVIRDLAICFRGGVVPNSTPQRGWTKLHQIWREQTSIIDVPNPNFGSDMLLRFEMTAVQKRVMSKSRPNFTHLNPPIKIRGGVGEISGSRFVASPTTEPRV